MARSNRPVSGLVSLVASPSRPVRAHCPGQCHVSGQWLAAAASRRDVTAL